MNDSLRTLVRERAENRCEYCRLPESATIVSHEADHIRSQKHRGETTPENLCRSCAWCNAYKGSDIAGLDPVDDSLTPLFNPRQQIWSDHFAWREAMLEGLTAVGRTNVVLLRMNLPELVERRKLLMELGEFFD